jgi:hypothetical protein
VLLAMVESVSHAIYVSAKSISRKLVCSILVANVHSLLVRTSSITGRRMHADKCGCTQIQSSSSNNVKHAS